MEGIETKELIDYYKKLLEYLKQLDNKKTEISNNLDAPEEPIEESAEEDTATDDAEEKTSENKEESKEENEDVINLDEEEAEKSEENA